MTDKIFRLGLALLISITLARDLGPTQFGLLQYALSFVGLFTMLASLGLDPILVREMVRCPDQTKTLLGTALGIRAIATLCITVSVLISNYLMGHDKQTAVIITIISAGLLFQPLQVIEQYFQAHTTAWISVLVYMFSSLVGAAWIVFWIAFDSSIIFFSAQTVIEAVLIAVGLYFGFRVYTGSNITLCFDYQHAVFLLKESWPLAFSLGMISVYINIDKVMIRQLLGAEATGIYVVAAKLSETWYFIPMVIVNSLFPAIVRARDTSSVHYKRRLQNLYDLMVWLAVMIAFPVSIFSDWIIVFFYSEAYRPAGVVLSLHVWTGVFVFLGVASGRWFILEGYTQAYMLRTFVGFLANILLNYLLIPKLGIIGAAWATLFAQVLVVLVFDAIWSPSRENCRMKFRALLPVHLIYNISGKKYE